MASRVAASSEAATVSGCFSHTLHAIHARGRFTTDGPSAMMRIAQMKILSPRQLRLRRDIFRESLAEHETDHHSDATDHDVRNICGESMRQAIGSVAVNENSRIEIALTGEEAHHAIQTINDAKQLEIKSRVFEGSRRRDGCPNARRVMQQIVIPLQAEYS